jgi:hypothetical protein
MRKSYSKPNLLKAAVTLQAVTAAGGPSPVAKPE